MTKIFNRPSQYSDKLLEMNLFFWILISLIFHVSESVADMDRYLLSPKGTTCQSTEDPDARRSPTPVKDFPGIYSEFIKMNPYCAQLQTCLNRERVSTLRLFGYLPKASDTKHFLSGTFTSIAKKACEDSSHRPLNPKDIKGLMPSLKIVYPPETQMIYQLVSATKQNVDAFIQDSVYAMDALKKCLALDVEYSKKGFDEQKKLEFYQSEIMKLKTIDTGCERLWQPDSEISLLKRQNVRLRQALLALKLLDEKAARNEDDVLSIARALKQGYNPGSMSQGVLQKRLGHLKGKFLNSSFWDGTPESIEPPNDHEKKQLESYLTDLRKEFPSSHFKLEEALKMDYFKTLSETPVLSSISSARPTSEEIYKAFSNFQNKYVQSQKNKTELDDLDYIKFPASLSYTVSQMPANQRGDYCVLAADALRLHEQDKRSSETTLMVLTAFESGGATVAAKGALKKMMAFLFGAQLSGNATLAVIIQNKTKAFNEELNNCLATPTQSGGACKLGQLESSYSDSRIAVGMAMMLAFGGSGKLAKAGVGAALSVSGSSPEKTGEP